MILPVVIITSFRDSQVSSNIYKVNLHPHCTASICCTHKGHSVISTYQNIYRVCKPISWIGPSNIQLINWHLYQSSIRFNEAITTKSSVFAIFGVRRRHGFVESKRISVCPIALSMRRITLTRVKSTTALVECIVDMKSDFGTTKVIIRKPNWSGNRLWTVNPLVGVGLSFVKAWFEIAVRILIVLDSVVSTIEPTRPIIKRDTIKYIPVDNHGVLARTAGITYEARGLQLKLPSWRFEKHNR